MWLFFSGYYSIEEKQDSNPMFTSNMRIKMKSFISNFTKNLFRIGKNQ